MYRHIRNSYLILAILGIITAIPGIGWVLDFLCIFTFGLTGLSLYIIIQLSGKNDHLRIGAILMLIACSLSFLGRVTFFVTSLNLSHFTDNSMNEAFFPMMNNVFSMLYAMVLLFNSWWLKITAIVFCFKHYNALNKFN